MNFTVINHQLAVDNINIIAVASSSLFIVGDTQFVSLSSIFDTPPESLIVGPLVPLTPK